MSIKDRINHDLKNAMLSGDKTLTNTLRVLKSAILDVEVATNKRDIGLTEPETIQVLQKEAKKRQESADMFLKGNRTEKSDSELYEKKVILNYLPEQMSESELMKIVDETISESGAKTQRDMGSVIGAVKMKVAGKSDGSVIARLVKSKLGND